MIWNSRSQDKNKYLHRQFIKILIIWQNIKLMIAKFYICTNHENNQMLNKIMRLQILAKFQKHNDEILNQLLS